MNKPTFYEQVGIVIPGAVMLFGLLLFFPALKDVLAKDGITIGELGVFVLLSYAAGNLVAAVGNVGENILWRLAGGMPSDWVIKTNPTILSEQQRDQVEQRVRSRLKIEIASLRGLDRKVWWPISRQIYANVARYGKPDRIDTFNGNYGLNRGLSAACLILACIALTQKACWPTVLLLAFSVVYAYRAYRFGVHYGRELYMQFLTASDEPVVTKENSKSDSES